METRLHKRKTRPIERRGGGRLLASIGLGSFERYALLCAEHYTKTVDTFIHGQQI